jgi:hypothetical protein
MSERPGRDSIGTIDELHAAATERTGLGDFGADDYREALAVLLDSYAREASLTPWGNRINHAQLRDALIARLLSEAGWRRYPEHAAISIDQPIFITGLPRTGTTALHRLLCADAGHQGLEMWLTAAPQPRPPRETWDDDPTFQRLQQRLGRHQVEDPEFMGMHYMSADMPEECWQLLRQSIMSIGYETVACLPTYSRWLAEQDWTGAYRRHRRNLQLIGLHDSPRRWVLKNPSHLFSLPALMAVYPDALVVQTHRDPRAVIASISSLTSRAVTGQSEAFAGEVVGRVHLELWARGAETFLADRVRYDPAQFIDVAYADFVADPIRPAEAIYERLSRPLTAEARAAMNGVLKESTAGDRRPSHRYSLSDFNLTDDEVEERFAQYLSAHPDAAASA